MTPLPGTPASPLYIGIDPASSLAAVASIDENANVRHAVLRARGTDMPRRLGTLRTQLLEFLTDARDVGSWCCVVEIPITRFPNPTLLAAYGVLTECAGHALRCPVLTLTPSEIDALVWRAGKPGGDRKARCMSRARELGYVGDSQDVADALVAADCARVLAEDMRRKEAA